MLDKETKESVMCVQCKYQTRYETRNTFKKNYIPVYNTLSIKISS